MKYSLSIINHTVLSEKGVGKKLTQTHHFILAEAFEIPKDFSRKVLCVGVWGDAPTDNARKKHGIAVLFISTYF